MTLAVAVQNKDLVRRLGELHSLVTASGNRLQNEVQILDLATPDDGLESKAHEPRL